MDAVIAEVHRIWDLRDRRNDGWPLLNSPLPTVLLCLTYYYIVRVAGPRFMANRPAYELRGVLVVYNLFQIVFNAWIFWELGMCGWLTGQYNYFCQPVDYSPTNETAVRALHAGYWFFISKFIDFFDTFFFVLRKKNNQITALHLYHHFILPISIWPGTRYVCGGHAMFFAFINSLVHVVMYLYYLLAAMGPRFEKYTWWKKYLTSFQITQFVVGSAHCFQLFFKNECNFPKAFYIWIGFHEVCFFILFVHFYREAYSGNKRKSAIQNSSSSSSSMDVNNNANSKGKKKLH